MIISSSESSFTEIDGDDSEVENFPGTDNNNGDSSVTSSVGPHIIRMSEQAIIQVFNPNLLFIC